MWLDPETFGGPCSKARCFTLPFFFVIEMAFLLSLFKPWELTSATFSHVVSCPLSAFTEFKRAQV